MKTYRYVRDDGSFVPGLPKEVTDEEAKERGIYDLLMKAVKAGLYEEVNAEIKTEAKPRPKPRPKPTTGPKSPGS